MELTEVFTELETVFEKNGLDEAWTDWMRDCTQHLSTSHDSQERAHLLLQIKEGEAALSRVGVYLSDAGTSYGKPCESSPRYQVEHLIHTLDMVIQSELRDTPDS